VTFSEVAVKHSHQLLLALAALAAALLLFFWPRSTAAAPLGALHQSDALRGGDGFEERCRQLLRPSFTVTASAPTFVLNTAVSTRVLSTRSAHASGAHSVMGMTASRTLADIAIDGDTLLDASASRECLVPRIQVELRFEPLDVYVAREFSQHSCAYRAVLKHEMDHVQIYARELGRIEALVRAELLRRHGGGPVYGSPGKGIDVLQAQISAWLDPLLRQELVKVELLQAQLDTPEETDKLSHACLGEVAMMMGSSF
jgi:hypothetical protein